MKSWDKAMLRAGAILHLRVSEKIIYGMGYTFVLRYTQDANTWSDKTAAREKFVPRCLLPTSTFSTTCFPKEHTLVEHVMTMFSGLSYWLETP